MAKKSWCVPKPTDEFRDRMEDVLTLYEQPHKRTEPVICLDEQPYQLIDDVRPQLLLPPDSLPNRTKSTAGVAHVTCSWRSNLQQAGDTFGCAGAMLNLISPAWFPSS